MSALSIQITQASLEQEPVITQRYELHSPEIEV